LEENPVFLENNPFLLWRVGVKETWDTLRGALENWKIRIIRWGGQSLRVDEKALECKALQARKQQSA
jgi:hypothetical protein